MQKAFLFFLGLLTIVSSTVDKTKEPRTYGKDVAVATVRQIQDTCIFPNDYQFMIRVAWVESQFGDDLHKKNSWTSESGLGGIWQVDEPGLQDAQDVNSHQTLRSTRTKILNDFDIDLFTLNRKNEDLLVPIKGGLASRAYLSVKPGAIPMGIEDQAEYWKSKYNSGAGKGSAADFVNRLKSMPDLCESPGADLLFILDSSGSISTGDFQTARNFISAVVEKLPVDDKHYKIAVENFSTRTTSVIKFNSYTDRDDLLNQIKSIVQYGQGTYMGSALDHAFKKSFSPAEGARDKELGYPRIAVLITDGEPYSDVDTEEAAERVREAGINLNTVGVGGGADMDLLYRIASNPKCMTTYRMTNYETLAAVFPEELKSRSCQTAAVAPATGDTISNTIGKDKILFFQFTADAMAGITFKLTRNHGSVNLYLSKTVKHPSDIMYDKKIEGDGQLYLGSKDLADKETIFHLANIDVLVNSDVNKTAAIFGSIKGMQDSNNFTLKYEHGNTKTSASASAKMSVVFLLFCVILVSYMCD